VLGEDYTDTFGRQWSRWARTQHDSLNGTRIFRDRFESYTGWDPESLAGKVVVDAGCGPGGFIDVIERHAGTVVGFDLSVAIDACYELHGRHPSVHLAQADIFKPPVRPQVADRLYTFGVVQHTPDPERAFRSLVPLLRPGGEIAVWVYRRSFIPQPTYWLRRITAGMPEPRATRFIEWYVPKAMFLSGLLGRVPGAGRYLRRFVPVADYRGRLPTLTNEQYYEWALMDTHDGLITRYTFPQRWRDLERWMTGLEGVRRPNSDLMAGVARVPGP
jgi:SAM-dependent methyltransferase